MSVNKVILLGRLGKDPELRYTAGNTPVCTFSLATSERKKDQTGNWVDHAEWHNIVTFQRTAENCQAYLKKGREVFIDGRIQTRKWQDKEGRDRWTTEIVANNVTFVGGNKQQEGGNVSQPMAANGENFSGGFEESPAVTAGREVISGLTSADSMASQAAPSSGSGAMLDDDDIPF